MSLFPGFVEKQRVMRVLERRIDRALPKNPSSKDAPVVILIPPQYRFKEQEFYESIMELYRKKGWKVILNEKTSGSRNTTQHFEFFGYNPKQ